MVADLVCSAVVFVYYDVHLSETDVWLNPSRRSDKSRGWPFGAKEEYS